MKVLRRVWERTLGNFWQDFSVAGGLGVFEPRDAAKKYPRQDPLLRRRQKFPVREQTRSKTKISKEHC